MPSEKVEFIIRGGEATPAPPIGPGLSPLGVNVGLVVKEINEKTAGFKGMDVPVKVVVDTNTKKYTISLGTPPVTSMLKKELKKEKLATVAEDKKRISPGSISLDAVVRIAKSKDSIQGGLEAKVKQVLGTCVSGGITIDGKDPRDIIKGIKEGSITVE